MKHAHLPASPLDFFHNVEAAVHDELVHVPGLLPEARDAVPALLEGAEFKLEEGIVFGPDDREVVRHDSWVLKSWR